MDEKAVDARLLQEYCSQLKVSKLCDPAQCIIKSFEGIPPASVWRVILKTFAEIRRLCRDATRLHRNDCWSAQHCARTTGVELPKLFAGVLLRSIV